MLTTSAALGNIEYASWQSPSLWAYKIKYMPDFDQRRMAGSLPQGGFSFGLPGNGSYYCVPTSAMNLMAYIAQHGFPAVSPGAGSNQYWMGQPPYNDVTFELLDMGIIMETASDAGTDGDGELAGVTEWLGFYAPGVFDVNRWYLAPGHAPNLTTLAGAAINGSLVNFAYGKYENAGEFAGLIGLGERVGGHVVTLSSALRWGPAQVLSVRDPADDSVNLQTQSTFANRSYEVEDHGVFICVPGDCSQTMTMLNYDPDADYVYMIDSYLTIKPRQGYAFVPANEVIIYQPHAFQGWSTPGPSAVPLPRHQAVVDLVAMPDGDGFYYIDESEGVAGIWSINSITGESTSIATVDSAQQILVGANRLVYVLTGEAQVVCVNPAAEDEPVADSLFLPSIGNGFAYRDQTHELAVVSFWDHELMFVQTGPDGLGAVEVQDLPVTLTLGEHVCVAADPPGVGDTIWIASDGAPVVYGVRKNVFDSFEVVELPTGGGVGCIDLDDSGRLYVGTDAGPLELVRNADGDYVVVPEEAMRYRDVPPGASFSVSRSRTNFDPKIHLAPGWATNLDPDTLPEGTIVADCVADLTDDGDVDASDLAVLLGAWGPNVGHTADLDEDGVVNAADLAILLGTWGPCR
ncbi:MAG: hypothetical protein KDA25_00760 [Phycisphaerales bacterium]|nr:hypothetical protein [Phycisphaerales bacterium]